MRLTEGAIARQTSLIDTLQTVVESEKARADRNMAGWQRTAEDLRVATECVSDLRTRLRIVRSSIDLASRAWPPSYATVMASILEELPHDDDTPSVLSDL